MSTSKSFGAFFRAKRKALGLTLREFCRRNGFDPGNVSRLERGLVPPPQARQLLESYAKALKLESGTWHGIHSSSWPRPRPAEFRPMSWKTNGIAISFRPCSGNCGRRDRAI